MTSPVKPTGPDPAGALIRLIATTRDRDAFERLFIRYAPGIRAYLRKSGCADGEAEELTQEAMLAVWRKAQQFDPQRATAAAWIYAIARNLRVDGLRRLGGSSIIQGVFAEASPPQGDDLPETWDVERLHAALANLPAEQMQVIHAAFLDHRPHAEIAHVLGLPLGTVKSRLRLALKRLRADMEPIE